MGGVNGDGSVSMGTVLFDNLYCKVVKKNRPH